MSDICKACGAALPEGAEKCAYCDTPVPKKRFCRICGTEYGEGARFCRKCGNATLQSAKTGKPAVPQEKVPAQSAKAKQRKSPAVAAVVLILIFAVVIAAVTAGRRGGITTGSLTGITYSKRELATAGIKATVSPDSPAVTAGETVLDFGAFNLYGENIVEVKALPEKTDSRTGVTVRAYDFTLSHNASGEAVTEFPTLVDITIPCTAAENEYAFVQHYDPESDSWRIIDSVRDYKNNTLTFQTTHFSIFGETKIVFGSGYGVGPDGEIVLPSQSFAYVGGYRDPLSEVYFVAADLEKLMDPLEFEKLTEILRSCKVYPHDMMTALMGLGNDAANVLDLKATNTLIATMMMRPESGLEKYATGIRLVGSALVFAKVAYQLHMGGDIETVAYINAVNLAEALLTVAGVALGSEALLMMATVVFLSNTVYGLATLEMTTIQEQGYINFNDGLGAVFYAESMNVAPVDTPSLSQAYYAPSGPILLDRGGKGFARALDAIYDHYAEKPADLQKAVEKLIDGYVNCFWDSPLTDEERVRYAYYHEKYDAGNPPVWVRPSAEAVQNYKDKFREKLMSDIKPLMRAFSERVLHDLKLRLRDTIEKEYVPILNTVITIQAGISTGEAFDKSVWADDYSMRFSPQQTPFWVSADRYMADYNPRLRTAPGEIYKSTVYNYLQIGDPPEIEFMSETGVYDDFYTPVDWTGFPDGRITVAPKQREAGSLSYYDHTNFSSSDYEKDIGRLLLQKGRVNPAADGGVYKLQAAGTVTEEGSAGYNETAGTTIKSSDLLIEFNPGEGDACAVSGSVITTASRIRTEEYSGDYWSVTEYWISDSARSYSVNGTGRVSYRSTYDDELGTVKLMVLTFDAVNITGTFNYKITSKSVSQNSSDSEVIDENSVPINEFDRLVLEFIVD
ncbi:MAG: zinc ribbon domain-containing protein [Eubacteriales bacterium]|nr:zinc ribbon domain-containing protein [Eubacteriales bacterium]